MVTAVIAAPVPPPTIAAMPTMAKAGTLTPAEGSSRFASAAKAPPRVAPMNSDGEKIPPDEPEPRLSDVASSFADEQQRQERHAADGRPTGHPGPSHSRRLRRGSDRRGAKRDTSGADQTHTERVSQIGILESLEFLLCQMQAADEPGRPDAHDNAEKRIEAER